MQGRAEVVRSTLAAWGDPGYREHRAGVGWRVLQRECRQHGFGGSGRLPGERAGVPDGCAGSEERRWNGTEVAASWGNRRDGGAVGDKWRNDSETGGLHAGAAAGSESGTDHAGG